jgi:uncharacterized iron-regulated membrane protein
VSVRIGFAVKNPSGNIEQNNYNEIDAMNFFQRWAQAPQTSLLRRALFQVHLWLGIGLGLYVLVISISGSAILLKSPFYGWFEPKNVTQPDGVEELSEDEQRARMEEIYADYQLGFTMYSMEADKATYIVLQKDGEYIPHYFNQYTGEDLGLARPWQIKTVEWVADWHDDLLLGRELGRRINGAGGALFILMSFTGLIIWWQGKKRWWEGLVIIPWSSRSIWWQIHSFCGFWALLLMLSWGVSGFQLGFPQQLNAIVEFFGGEPGFGPNRGGVLGFFRDVHFARPGSQYSLARWSWIFASFLPTVMFITGLIVWWRRVVMRWFNRIRNALRS